MKVSYSERRFFSDMIFKIDSIVGDYDSLKEFVTRFSKKCPEFKDREVLCALLDECIIDFLSALGPKETEEFLNTIQEIYYEI